MIFIRFWARNIKLAPWGYSQKILPIIIRCVWDRKTADIRANSQILKKSLDTFICQKKKKVV